jgi:hypothetical protein
MGNITHLGRQEILKGRNSFGEERRIILKWVLKSIMVLCGTVYGPDAGLSGKGKK